MKKLADAPYVDQMNLRRQQMKNEEISLKIEKPKFNPAIKREEADKQATKWWKHKPYECDFGGGKNEEEKTL